MPVTIGTPLLWGLFTLFILGLLALDLGIFHRRPHALGPKEALTWSLFWIGLALAFNAGVFWWFGPRAGLGFLTGYLIEKALSVDNIFVFLVIFSYFGVGVALQRRVLFWGILGAIVFRVIFILAGAALLATFHWVIYLFGALLLVTAVRIVRARHEEVDPERNPVLRLARRVLPVAAGNHGGRFFVRTGGRLMATPLLLVLLVVEATDIVFAIDSIPAIFAVTDDPFIVYTSNIFAILGLRALFFLVGSVLAQFRYLKVGLGLVLAFVGLKMLTSDLYTIPVALSLAVVAGLIGGAVVASLLWRLAEPPASRPVRRPSPLVEPGTD